jgi:hypothetical protein
MKRVRALASAVLRRQSRRDEYQLLHPFGTKPQGDKEAYLQLHRAAQALESPEIDAYERALGYAIDRAWLDELALVTQITIKPSPPNYSHGRILYAALRSYLSRIVAEDGAVTILETGTARGFSSLCMARALLDAGPCVPGFMVTVDVLPHGRRFLWNSIRDHDGPQTRQELLCRWPLELSRVVFLEGSTHTVLGRLGLARVGFAFLDAAHTFEDVMLEYGYVRDRQRAGDTIVFDDVTPGAFDGVVEAVRAIERQGMYDVSYLQSSGQRGYATAVRV